MSEEELRKEYQEYQRKVSESVTAEDFLLLEKSDVANTEVIRYEKSRNESDNTYPIEIRDREGKIILSGKFIEELPGFDKENLLVHSFLSTKDQMIIEYLDSKSGKEKIGIFNHCGFALVEDIEKFWDKRKKALNLRKVKEAFLPKYNIPNGVYEKNGKIIELKSSFNRDRVITIEQNPHYEFFPDAIYPTKILGKYVDMDLYTDHLAFYDLDTQELVKMEDSSIPTFPQLVAIHDNQITDFHDILYYFDDRSGTLINLEGKLTNIFWTSFHPPILKLKRPILTFSEFKKLKGKKIGIEREIKEKKEQEEKRNQARIEKERRNEQEILELVKRLEGKINDQKNSDEMPSYLHSILIEEEELLVFCDDHYEISEKYVGVLRFLNLVAIDFSNVKLDHIDFRETNASITPQTSYQKDISYSLFDAGNISPFQSLQDVKANGTDFSRCKFINLSGAQIDEETKLPLYPLGEFKALPNSEKKEEQKGKVKIKSLCQNQNQ